MSLEMFRNVVPSNVAGAATGFRTGRFATIRGSNHKDIESAMIDVIKVAYSQGIKKYDRLGASYVNYLKTLQQKRDPEDYIRFVAKKRAPNEETYNGRMTDFKDWYNEEIYTSL